MTTKHDAPSKTNEGEKADKISSAHDIRSVLQAGTAVMTSSLSNEDLEVIRYVIRQFTTTEVTPTGSSSASTVDRNGSSVFASEQNKGLAEFVRSLMATRGAIGEREVAKLIEAGYPERQIVDVSLAAALTVFIDVLDSIGYLGEAPR